MVKKRVSKEKALRIGEYIKGTNKFGEDIYWIIVPPFTKRELEESYDSEAQMGHPTFLQKRLAIDEYNRLKRLGRSQIKKKPFWKFW